MTAYPDNRVFRYPRLVINGSRVFLVLSDVIVLGVTWAVTHTYRSQNILRGFGRKTTLAGVMFQNGAFVCTCPPYFIGLTCSR